MASIPKVEDRFLNGIWVSRPVEGCFKTNIQKNEEKIVNVSLKNPAEQPNSFHNYWQEILVRNFPVPP